MTRKILNLLGLANRSQKLAIGMDAVCEAMLNRKTALILFASDFSKNSREKIPDVTGVKSIELEIDKDTLGAKLGKRKVGIVAVCDEKFTLGILKVIKML